MKSSYPNSTPFLRITKSLMRKRIGKRETYFDLVGFLRTFDQSTDVLVFLHHRRLARIYWRGSKRVEMATLVCLNILTPYRPCDLAELNPFSSKLDIPTNAINGSIRCSCLQIISLTLLIKPFESAEIVAVVRQNRARVRSRGSWQADASRNCIMRCYKWPSFCLFHELLLHLQVWPDYKWLRMNA